MMALRAVPEHPKFANLKAILGLPKGATLGWLEAMWHFTGRFTPQGNIGKYTDEAIEAWVEWNGKPGELIAALRRASWLDSDPVHRLLVHHWAQHADKATKMALQRSKTGFCSPTVHTPGEHSSEIDAIASTAGGLPVPEPVPVEIKTLDDDRLADISRPVKAESAFPVERMLDGAEWLGPTTPAALGTKGTGIPGATIALFLSAWNDNRGCLSKVLGLSEDRREKLQTRMQRGLTLERFTEAVRLCASTPFLTGAKDGKWRADFDWLIANDKNHLKVLEGKYVDSGARPVIDSTFDLSTEPMPPHRDRVISLAGIREQARVQ